jgi:hypothetical protein
MSSNTLIDRVFNLKMTDCKLKYIFNNLILPMLVIFLFGQIKNKSTSVGKFIIYYLSFKMEFISYK